MWNQIVPRVKLDCFKGCIEVPRVRLNCVESSINCFNVCQLDSKYMPYRSYIVHGVTRYTLVQVDFKSGTQLQRYGDLNHGNKGNC